MIFTAEAQRQRGDTLRFFCYSRRSSAKPLRLCGKIFLDFEN